MLQRGPVFVGDLKPIGVARPLAVVRLGGPLSSLVTISISCLSTLTLFAVGAAWLVPQGDWTSATFNQQPALAASAQPQNPTTFPAWVEVPHLTGPLAHSNDPDTFSVAGGSRTFLDPNHADTVEQLVFLPPRANPRLPLIGLVPLDATRLIHEQPPAWTERPGRQDIATAAPPSVVTTLEPDALPPSQHPAETKTTRTLPADPVPTLILSPLSAQARAPSEIVVRSAPAITTTPPLGHVATLSPDPMQDVMDRTITIAPPRGTGVVVAPVLNPGPARHAQALRKPKVATATSRLRMPSRDAEQTASIISGATTARGRIDAGAIAHAFIHRARDYRPASPSPSAPSSPWTLPTALAPTD